MSRHKREATQDELDVILKLKEEGCSQAVIAENVGLSKSMVRRILKDEFAEEKEILDSIFAEDNPEEKESVNHPEHYNKHKIECLQVVELFNFNRGSAMKYIWRSGEKDKKREIEDLEKAMFYIDREIERIKEVLK